MSGFAVPSGGSNPAWGRDQGGAPTAGQGPYSYGYGYGYGYGAYNYGGVGHVPYVNQHHQYYPQHYPQQAAYGAQYYANTAPGFAIPTPHPQQRGGYTYLSGFGGGTRHAQPHPIINPEMPATNMTNSTGGVGCEPGYNYFFAAENTKVHVLKSGSTPPWQLTPNTTVPFHACHVPVTTTIAELLRGFGATNPVPKKNRLTEVVQGGNGKWYKGISFSGDVAKEMSMTVKDVGWDKTRTGLPGQKPVVVLYITKD